MPPSEPLPPDLAAQTAWMNRMASRYRALADDRSQLFWLATPDGALQDSPGWCEFTGQPSEALQGMGAIEAIHPDDRARVEGTWVQAIATGRSFECEFRLRRHDGVFRWFISHGTPVLDEHGELLEWIGWCRDIERERRSAEATFAESQQLAKIGTFELDVATRQLDWSDQQFRNFGFEPATRINRDAVIARIHPADRGRHEDAIQKALLGGEVFTIDYRVVHPNGEVRHLHTIGRPVFDEAGHVAKMVGTTQDVTERAQMEERLRAQYEQVMALDQLKNNFVNSVTHELRTPLTSIMGYAEFLEDEIGGPVTAGQRVFVEQIQHGAKRLEYLLNDLLDFARLEAGTFTLKVAPAELGGRVRDVIESLKPQADEARLSVEATLPEGPLELEMDAQRIAQVLMNLLSNAIKFSPPGGAICIGAATHGDRLRVEVADAGPGITAAEMPRLFQRFSQLDAGVRMGKGAGLGLSISKALVEAHGGAIGVESSPGSGSTFWFELPLRHGPASQ